MDAGSAGGRGTGWGAIRSAGIFIPVHLKEYWRVGRRGTLPRGRPPWTHGRGTDDGRVSSLTDPSRRRAIARLFPAKADWLTIGFDFSVNFSEPSVDNSRTGLFRDSSRNVGESGIATHGRMTTAGSYGKVHPMTASIRNAAIVLKSLPRQDAERLLDRLEPQQAAAVSAEIAQLGVPDAREQHGAVRRFVARNPKSKVHRLLTAYRSQSPRTLAVLLSCLPVSLAAAVFCGLPEEVQPVVLRRIAKLQAVGPDVLDRLQRSLPVEVGASARDWPKTGGPKIGGLDRVTQILRRMDDPTAWDRLSREVFPAA